MSTSVPVSRTLLLVDDESNILSALQRALRRDGYRILASDDPVAALEILNHEPVDVILSDQRMPGMTGVEFLRRAKDAHPDTMRIVLSGYTDLQFITDAINEGAIYKFLTKPWDDAQLREQIREAFHRKEVDDENRRLSQALSEANTALQTHVEERERQADQLADVLDTLQEILQLLPVPLLGIDESGLIALSNVASDQALNRGSSLLGLDVEILPKELRASVTTPPPDSVSLQGRYYRVMRGLMGRRSGSRGVLLALLPEEW